MECAACAHDLLVARVAKLEEQVAVLMGQRRAELPPRNAEPASGDAIAVVFDTAKDARFRHELGGEAVLEWLSALYPHATFVPIEHSDARHFTRTLWIAKDTMTRDPSDAEVTAVLAQRGGRVHVVVYNTVSRKPTLRDVLSFGRLPAASKTLVRKGMAADAPVEYVAEGGDALRAFVAAP
jgi:hypothetical protein